MRIPYLLIAALCVSLFLGGCTIQRAPGAYAVAGGKKEPVKESPVQPEQPVADTELPREAKPVAPPVEEEKIVFKADKPEPVTVVEPEVIETVAPLPVVDTVPAAPLPEEKEVTRAEQFTVVEAQPENPLKDYNVVIGSFGRRENADGLKQRMTAEGYKPVIVVNDRGMFRVILATFDTYKEARTQIAAVKDNFADAWVLVQK